ncbi:hypothetical protein CK203_023470 [Vitis vinifera]|uniref:Uncharacterized protein n=1 Tax=Vitis vinifera TaxID=29760 RepID=A0A438J6K2_VITVI|nr:hypothetical protein CK203_023470 [Vitis vinifera]
MNELRPIVEESNLLDEERKLLEDRISQLDAEITDYNEARERAMPLVQEIEVKVKDLRQAIPSLNNQQMSLRTSFRKMKEKVAEMDEKISSAEFALVQSVQENANLRSKIVQSPDKLQELKSPCPMMLPYQVENLLSIATIDKHAAGIPAAAKTLHGLGCITYPSK